MFTYFLGVPGVRAQFWEILGHSYLLESGGILYAPRSAVKSAVTTVQKKVTMQDVSIFVSECLHLPIYFLIFQQIDQIAFSEGKNFLKRFRSFSVK